MNENKFVLICRDLNSYNIRPAPDSIHVFTFNTWLISGGYHHVRDKATETQRDRLPIVTWSCSYLGVQPAFNSDAPGEKSVFLTKHTTLFSTQLGYLF